MTGYLRSICPFLLQKLNTVLFTFFCDSFRPQGRLYLSNMCLAKEEHTDTGLSDSTTDCIRKLFVDDCFLERKFCTFFTACFFELGEKRFLVNPDTHGGNLKCDVEYRIVNNDICV